jgi:hypothetical protein
MRKSSKIRDCEKCQRRDLNPRPRAYESPALPLSYSGRFLIDATTANVLVHDSSYLNSLQISGVRERAKQKENGRIYAAKFIAVRDSRNRNFRYAIDREHVIALAAQTDCNCGFVRH